MALDPSIILQGQGVNALGILDASNRMAAQQKDALHTQGYRNMLATSGAGIMAGDQGALNALAGYDPAAALGIQGQRQEMDYRSQQMAALSAEEKRQAEEYARGLSAQERAAEAAQIEEAVKMGLMIPDAATWDQQMATMAPELVGQFANRQALAGKYMSMAEVLKMAFPEPADPLKGAPSGYMWNVPGNVQAGVSPIPGVVEKPQAPYTPEGKLKADFDAGRISQADYEAGLARLAPDGTSLTVDPATGAVTFTQGKPGAAPTSMKLTEQQSKDLVYWKRATGASSGIDSNEAALASLRDNTASGIPIVGNYMVSEGFQMGNQAAAEWLAAILRKDTGAAITSQEFDMYGPMFLPRPGDSEAVLKQKRVARKRAEDAIKSGLGTAEVLAIGVEPSPDTPDAPATGGDLQPGAIEDGFRFKGGDPSDPAAWEQVQ